MVSPGFVIDLHLGLVRIEDYEKEMEKSIANNQHPNNKIVTQWMDNNQQDDNSNLAILPEFKVIKTTVKWEK
eukprot:15365825-Ditylum_brightwellii.AAC.1